MVCAEAAQAWTHAAQAVDAMGFDQIRHDAAHGLATAVQQPPLPPIDSQWTEANVYMFMFDSEDPPVSSRLLMDRDTVLQWTRRAMTSVAAAWERFAVVLQQFAERSVATAPGDDNSPTTQR
jgi:hypothetical protein